MMIGYRKFSAFLILTTLDVTLLLTKHISGDNFTTLAVAIATGFFAGNLTAKVTNTIREVFKKDK